MKVSDITSRRQRSILKRLPATWSYINTDAKLTFDLLYRCMARSKASLTAGRAIRRVVKAGHWGVTSLLVIVTLCCPGSSLLVIVKLCCRG